MKTQPRGASESSTTSDNTAEFIEIVKKYDVVYNSHHPDYKNVEVKLKVWSQISEEIALSVDASKRKWKNLRDSYTKYLRSFRTGSKTSKKYQYWAHAEHMEFLKPFQGPGRNHGGSHSTKVIAANEDDETESDLGFQVLAKAADEDGIKVSRTASTLATTPTLPAVTATTSITPIPMVVATATSAPITTTQAIAAIPPIQCSVQPNTYNTQQAPQTFSSAPIMAHSGSQSASTTLAPSSALVMPLPAVSGLTLPPPPLPPQLQPASIAKTNVSTTLTSLPISAIPAIPTLPAVNAATLQANVTGTTQIFPLPLPQFTATPINGKNNLQMPVCSTASNVGCLILEPQLFASQLESFKKELSTPAGAAAAAAFGLFTNLPQTTQVTAIGSRNSATKIRRVQPSPQTAAINLSCPSVVTGQQLPTLTPAPPNKTRKLSSERNSNQDQVDIGAILQANRDLDANTLFFLSLARTVRLMPTKFQSLAKMRCMRIVSDIELELENAEENSKFCNAMEAAAAAQQQGDANGNNAEHFVYCMSPSRLENMIDISSDDEAGG